MATSLLRTHPFGEAYGAQAGSLSGSAHLVAMQQAARAEIARGLPGPKHEEWRFTPLTSLAKIGFVPAATADDVDVPAVPLDVPHVSDAVRIVLVNGVYRADLSDKAAGVSITPLREAARDVDAIFGSVASNELPLVALNTAFLTDGLVIAASKSVARPVHLISIGASGGVPLAFHPRMLITTAPGAALTLIESHVGLPGQPFFANPVTEILVAEDATVRRYVSVTEDNDSFHIATAGVTVAARGTFEAFHLGLAGGRSEGTMRQEVHVLIEGAGAKVNLGGVYALDGDCHHDFTTVITHRSGGSTSNQLFKGVLDGQSHGVYQGRVQVIEKAQKTDARQLHKALFLSAGPAVDVKPELEIAADDVQCAHGATTGSIDPDHMFYLAARGLDPEAARALLIEGFLADALAQIGNDSVSEIFGRQVSAWLQKRGGAS